MQPLNTIELDIASRRPYAAGAPYGGAGAYETLQGHARYAFDPAAAACAGITDLGLAPRDADGLLRMRADFHILKPCRADQGNGRLLFEWCNRGNKLALQAFNDAAAGNEPASGEDAGNGFLMRRGYTLAWLAWQGDILPGDGRMTIDLPTARAADGPLTGPARREFIVESPGIFSLPLSGQAASMSCPAASLDDSLATLTRRRHAADARIPVPRGRWRFARMERSHSSAETAMAPSSGHLFLDDGFEPGWIYELVYTARDPKVLGLGLYAVREFLGFLRHEGEAARNPLAGAVRKVYGWGHSQSARAIREFIYCGFNADDRGRRLCDGVLVHGSGAGRLWLNHRYANASATAGQQYEDHYSIADRHPFSYASSRDHLTGRVDAILKRPASDPLVMHIQTASEYWQRHASLVHTDTQGNDLVQPDTVRIYHFCGAAHFTPAAGPPADAQACQLASNPLATGFFMRAILDALDAWAGGGKPPPASRMPARADRSLLDYADWRRQFPGIPGVAVPACPNPLPLLDFGPRAERGILDKEPPEVLDARGYTVLVPAVDHDGNEYAGLRAPEVAVPAATYTGWNLRRDGQGKGAMYRFTGSIIPFAPDPGTRRMSQDPRPALAERHAGPAARREALVQAARELLSQGFMLQEDLQRLEAGCAAFCP